jgi:imidazolonepropionase-like amidohydrolase
MGIWLPMPKVRSRLLVATLLLLLVINPLHAQHSAIDTYAITNARIVTVSGPVIERGTVVIRNGLIAAAGALVNAPSVARVIDGTGLSVYPGLIESYTHLA